MTGDAADKTIGGWYSFELAAEEVERRLGVTWGAAQKTVMELCENGTLRWQNVREGGPNVSCNDLRRWLEAKLTRKRGGKQARLTAQLSKMFPNGCVPDPDECPRDALREDLVERDKTLRPLDHATLKKAIDRYNGTIAKPN
jgi:hypothetical protein